MPSRAVAALTPAPSRICLVTSHFALPLDDGSDPTKLNQAFVDSLTTPVLDRKYRHYDENGEAMRSQLKQLLMQQQMMLHSLQETSTPPTVGDFDRAMRLLRRTTHYKVAKGLRERAATDARRRAARRSKSKRLQLKGGWPIEPTAHLHGLFQDLVLQRLLAQQALQFSHLLLERRELAGRHHGIARSD